MTNDKLLKEMGLRFNPFPPAATSVAVVKELWIPRAWQSQLESRYQHLSSGQGDKALVIVGGYGSGKTYLLHWISKYLFEGNRFQSFFFDNPGVAFYDLANRLLRQVGRYELSKGLWELLSPKILSGSAQRLIPLNFPEWLRSVKRSPVREEAIESLAGIIRDVQLTNDEEIAHRLARMLVETGDRPYFEYRDFVAGKPKALVAEREEARYFNTLISILCRIYNLPGIAFLIDEFEDVALQRRLNRKQSFEYLGTLRRLLDVTREQNFWLIISMTPEAFKQTTSLDPSLVQRFVEPFEIPPLSTSEAKELVVSRLREARAPVFKESDVLWPFSKDLISLLSPTVMASPRRLIKVCWQAIAYALERNIKLPIPAAMVTEAEKALYPAEESSQEEA
jgi:type II secretory pathway predicted ATPase ExeA